MRWPLKQRSFYSSNGHCVFGRGVGWSADFASLGGGNWYHGLAWGSMSIVSRETILGIFPGGKF